jgi:hypothetical protein
LLSVYSGYACVSTDGFFKFDNSDVNLQEPPLFKADGHPVIKLSQESKAFISTIFQKMLTDQNSDYKFKDELIRDYIGLLIHEANTLLLR